MIISWMFISMVGGPVNIAFIALCVLLLKLRNKYTELLAGLWFVCTMSDNRLKIFGSFEQAKYVYIVLLTIFLVFNIRKFAPLNPFYLRFLPFIIVSFYCIVHAPSIIFFTSFSKTLSYFFLLFTIPNYVVKSYQESGRDFIKLFIYVAVFVLTVGLLLKIFLPLAVSFEARYRGLLGNPNGTGMYCLVVFLLFVLINRSLPDLFHRQEKIIVYSLLFVSVFLCGSRNTIAAILIYVLFSYFTRISPLLGFFILLFTLTAYEYVNINLVTIVQSLGAQNYLRAETLSNAAGRYIAWKFAWDNISKDIFLGHGFEYTNYLFELNQKTLNDFGHQGNAHNSYLTFWLDTGIVGLLFFMFGFVGAFIKAARKQKVIIAAMFAILFSAFFESYLTSSLNPYMIVIVLILTVFSSDEILSDKNPAIIPLH
jgi:O-antigen ligase